MPKSRKRKLTKGQKVKGSYRRALREAANKEAVMPIYARAFPERQDYQPVTFEVPKLARRKPTPEMPEAPRPGALVTHGDGRQYMVQRDGSWRRVRVERERKAA